MQFEFSTAERILFGTGRLSEVAERVKPWGPRILIVTGRSAARVRPLAEGLERAGLEPRLLSVTGEPTVELVVRGCQLARDQRSECVVALGGGSAIDAGKAIAALVPNPGDVLDYLEVVGQGRPLSKPGLPFVAVPTTAGTGAEVTRNAVLASAEHRVKVSLRSSFLLARLVVIDPELSYGMPARLTAATGLDALTQLIEPFVSCRANPFVDALCRGGLVKLRRSLRVAHRAALRGEGDASVPWTSEEKEARADMALAACLSGLALANAGLGAVHGFAGPIGGMFPAPHGEVCAVLLPEVMARNIAALRARSAKHPALLKYAEIGRLLSADEGASAEDGLAWVRALVADMGPRKLSEHGVTEADLPTLVEKAQRASSMKGNPLALTSQELTQILKSAL